MNPGFIEQQATGMLEQFDTFPQKDNARHLFDQKMKEKEQILLSQQKQTLRPSADQNPSYSPAFGQYHNMTALFPRKQIQAQMNISNKLAKDHQVNHFHLESNIRKLGGIEDTVGQMRQKMNDYEFRNEQIEKEYYIDNYYNHHETHFPANRFQEHQHFNY